MRQAGNTAATDAVRSVVVTMFTECLDIIDELPREVLE